MRFFLLITVPIILFFIVRAEAQTPPQDAGRFIMRQTEDGFLRLDTATGAVSICRRQAGDWVCSAIADDRSALEAEIARLSDENKALQEKLAALSQQNNDEPRSLELPTKEDMDKVMGFFEETMRRLNEMVDDFNKEREQVDEEPQKKKI